MLRVACLGKKLADSLVDMMAASRADMKDDLMVECLVAVKAA